MEIMLNLNNIIGKLYEYYLMLKKCHKSFTFKNASATKHKHLQKWIIIFIIIRKDTFSGT